MGNYNFELDLETENTMKIINGWISPDSDVLEFGPANGRLTKYLSEEKRCKVTIVEIDEEAGKEAAQYACKSYLGAEDGNIEHFHWLQENAQYDYILFADVLEHLHDPQKVLEACAQKLKTGGNILLSVPNLGHNSVLIGLLKDRFDYANAGLLDQTHVHFFTYQSLLKTIQDSGFFVEECVPVYSRVNDNEIEARYDEVPITVEKYLRSRDTGSVYQFVCKIGKENQGKEWSSFQKPFEQEQHHYIEARCYFLSEGQTEYSDTNSTRCVKAADGDISLSIALLPKVRSVRISPLMEQSIIFVTEAKWVLENGETVDCEAERSSAVLALGGLYVFAENEPQLEYAANQEVVALQFSYKILSYSESREAYKEYAQILIKEVSNVNQIQVCDSEEAKRQKRWIEQLEFDLADVKQDRIHLEDDLTEIKQDRDRLISDLEEIKQDRDRLISDLEEIKQDRDHLMRDLEEIKQGREADRLSYEASGREAEMWAKHLESDLAELQAAREQERINFEASLQEAKDFIAHLEKDILDLQQALEKKKWF